MRGEGRALFLDRDGVLTVEGGDYVTRPEQLCMIPGAAEAAARLCKAGWKLILFTNQAGVGRGLMTLQDLEAIHIRLEAILHDAGADLEAIYACTHRPNEGCSCRKPKPGMLLQAAEEHRLDLTRCLAAGDSPRDIAAAHIAGCLTILLLSGHTQAYRADTFPALPPRYVLADLVSLADWLIALPEEEI